MATSPIKRPKLEQGTTPIGVLVFPNLTKPDTGPWAGAKEQYSARIKLGAEDSAKMIAKFEGIVNAMLEQAKKDYAASADPKDKARAKKVKLMPDLCYKAAVDDQGDETGEYIFNIKMNASYTDKKTGAVKRLKPDLFDCSSPPKPFPAGVDIWGGTLAKVAYELNPFANPKGEYGMSLRLKAVQIVQLRTAGGRDAEGYGFGAEEGYQAPEQATFPTGDDDGVAGAPDTTDNDDF